MDESNHQQFIKERQRLIENSNKRVNSNRKFYFLGSLVAFLILVPVGSYFFLTQRIIQNNGYKEEVSQIADTQEEVIVEPLESFPTSTPSATPKISK